jgi:hypothetical protein
VFLKSLGMKVVDLVAEDIGEDEDERRSEDED